MENIPTFVWVLVIGLFVFYPFGLWEGNGKGYKKRKTEEELERREKPAPFPATVKVDDPGLLRIKNEQGTMTLDLDGQRVQPTALTADQRKRLIEMLNVMRPWLEGRPASVPAPTSPPRPQPTPVPAPIASVAPHPVASTQQPKSAPVASAKKDEEPEAAPTSMVGQINLILQHRINNTPLEARGVSLMESASGGVNVYIGVKRYDAIDDVPDAEIKAAIRAAIAEWEKKYTPGL